MRIVHISHSDQSGGAARAAYRTHQYLIEHGADSSMFVLNKGTRDERVTNYFPKGDLFSALTRGWKRFRLRRANDQALHGRDTGYEHFRDDRDGFGQDIFRLLPDADVYHLHQITGFINYQATLPLLTKRAKLVWTLHEMTPMTGGCPYSYDCDGFTRSCGNCPQLGDPSPDDFSRQIWTRKNSTFSGIPADRLHLSCPSNWMAAEARRSSLLGKFPSTVIPNGVDTAVFFPRRSARRLLDDFGVPPKSKVVLFLADYLGNRRKGFAHIDRALALLKGTSDITILSLGNDHPALTSGVRHVHLGSLQDDRLIASVFSMADVFVIPSLAEVFGLTVIESMACETPVIGFNVGGIPDIIRHGENGFLVPVGDDQTLAARISEVLGNEAMRLSMGAAARSIAQREFDQSLQSERHLTLYRTLTSSI